MILDGKAVSANIKEELKQATEAFKSLYAKVPCLAVIQVGKDSASSIYVDNKIKTCNEIGFKSKIYHFINLSETALIDLIKVLNADQEVHGILVQLPLPDYINEQKVLKAISPEKDVDAFHPYNTGLIMQGKAEFLPCTPAGIVELLKRSNIEIAGKECVIVGRSNIVGKPIAHLLLQANGTVTICHSKTVNLAEICKRADILVCAIGRPKFFNNNFIKPGAVVIDVGINRDENGKLCGDVDFDSVADTVSAITPVPGGVGPMTIAMLMKNTYHAALNANLVDQYSMVKEEAPAGKTIRMDEGPDQFKTIYYNPTCPHGYTDCVFDPAYIKATYPGWYFELYGIAEPKDVTCEQCTQGERYDDEDK